MKKIMVITALVCAFCSLNTYAAPLCSDWAEESIEKAYAGGLLTEERYSGNFGDAITRAEIAELVVKAYNNVSGDEMMTDGNHFSDGAGEYAEKAYALGLMNGTGDDTFSPNNFATRQEMAKIILTLKTAVGNADDVSADINNIDFIDAGEISDWAREYVAKAAAYEIINGYPDRSFKPHNTVSYEEAVALLVRSVELNEKEGVIANTMPSAPEIEINLSNSVNAEYPFGNARFLWNSNNLTTVKVTQERDSYYKGDIAPKSDTYTGKGYVDVVLNPNRIYTIEINGITRTFKTAMGKNTGGDEIRADYPATKELAEAFMVDVTVPVWRLFGGTKVSSVATVTVHKKIADKIKLVFEDIYNGEEKFPIKDVGAYAWRGGKSEHNGGTAIDINASENYCIYSNGTVIGNYWKPYEDEYSITPYGDVVNAFEKYGFTWGGDAWRNPRDYMHFSYLGT